TYAGEWQGLTHDEIVARYGEQYAASAEELAAIRAEIGEEAFAAGKWQQAHDLLLRVSLDADYADFLTLPAYEQLVG
ncbi:malate synthase A, partial [Streptomyces sp. NPDC000963]